MEESTQNRLECIRRLYIQLLDLSPGTDAYDKVLREISTLESIELKSATLDYDYLNKTCAAENEQNLKNKELKLKKKELKHKKKEHKSDKKRKKKDDKERMLDRVLDIGMWAVGTVSAFKLIDIVGAFEQTGSYTTKASHMALDTFKHIRLPRFRKR